MNQPLAFHWFAVPLNIINWVVLTTVDCDYGSNNPHDYTKEYDYGWYYELLGNKCQ